MPKNHNLEYYPSEKVLNPPQYTKEEIREILRRINRINKSKIIVDFGAGTGRLIIALLRNNYRVLAVDIDNKSLKELIKSAKIINKFNKLKTVNKLPEKIKFNLITGSDILHHINLEDWLPIFYKHLNIDGQIIFSEPNAWHLFWWLFIFLFLNFKEEKGLVQCSYFSLERGLKKSGFSNIKISGLGLFPTIFFNKYPFFAKINYFLGNLSLIKIFAYRMIVVAEK